MLVLQRGTQVFSLRLNFYGLHKTSNPKLDDPEDKTAFALKVADLLKWKDFNKVWFVLFIFCVTRLH